MTRGAVFVMSLLHLGCLSSGYQIVSPKTSTKPHRQHSFHHEPGQSKAISRRDWTAASIAAVTATLLSPATASAAAEKEDPATTIIAPIRTATRTLQKLIDNWEDSVVDCNYADVPRELLETKNKEQLLEKASTFALFD